MRSFLLCVVILSLEIGHASGDNNSTDPPTYEVKQTEVAPTIDGIFSEGEWDAASPAAADWVGLIGHAPDTHELQFCMLWDDENLYLLGETNWAGFGPPKDFLAADPALDESVYNPRIFFNPNVDDEDWSSDAFNPTEPDGYSISWSMSEGFAARRPTNQSQAFRDPLDEDGNIFVDYIPGFQLEANVNSLTGNNGGWDITEEQGDNYRDNKHPGIVFAQLSIDTPLDETEQPGGVFEFSISWSEFNATDPNSGDSAFDPESADFLENGLFHPMAPEADEIWGFEIGVRTNDPENPLPSWSEPMGGNEEREEFADWNGQHGRIQFTIEFPEFDCDRSGEVDTGDLTCMTIETRDPTLQILNLLIGDVNADRNVDFSDFLILADGYGEPVDNYTLGDLNIDGKVRLSDFLLLADNFGKKADSDFNTSVPEASSFVLLLLGLIGIIRRSHRW